MATLTTPASLDISCAMPKQGMPVTIIMGANGSGKTTLLNHVLKNKQNLKIAVLINEFGDIDIDSQSVVSIDKDVVKLSNGCICCTMNEGLVDAVYQILEREDEIDYIIVETSGLADPLPLILTFLSEELRYLTRLDSIITVINTASPTLEYFEIEAGLMQVVYADVVLLNKVDLVDLKKIQEVEEFIQDVKAKARILHTKNSEVALPLISDIALTTVANDTFQATNYTKCSYTKNQEFISLYLQIARPFDVHKFETLLADQLPESIFRAKGLLWFNDNPLCHIFQLSGSRYNLDTDAWKTPPQNQIVITGHNLDINKTYIMFEECFA